MDIAALIRACGPDMSAAAARQLAAAWTPRFAAKGSQITRQGTATDTEIMLLDGQAVSLITDADGRGVCVGLHQGPGLVTPHIARSRDDVSLVTVEVTADATLAEMPAEGLIEMMLHSAPIRDWANAILREALTAKTEREWALAALKAGERLAWFRTRHPAHEAQFAHGHIASYLGMTPVSLSRLRHAR